MQDLIQLLGKKQRDWLTVADTLFEREKTEEIEQLICFMLEDIHFQKFLKFDQEMITEINQVSDFLLFIGMKLLLSYQAMREDEEIYADYTDLDFIENTYYAASAFVHISQKTRI